MCLDLVSLTVCQVSSQAPSKAFADMAVNVASVLKLIYALVAFLVIITSLGFDASSVTTSIGKTEHTAHTLLIAHTTLGVHATYSPHSHCSLLMLLTPIRCDQSCGISGVTSLVVGLAMKTVISDMFDACCLWTNAPFRVGDLVNIGKAAPESVVEVRGGITRGVADCIVPPRLRKHI